MIPKKKLVKKSKSNGVLKGVLITFSAIVGSFFILYLIVFTVTQLMFFDFLVRYFPEKPIRGVNILAFGIDDTAGVKRSDTIMLLHLDSKSKKIGVLSIPRDTKVKIENHGFTRVNHAYAYGGTRLLRETVSSFLGIPIDHYIRININGISQFIDHIGGIELNVEQDLYYQDNAQDLTIDLKKGEQYLSGNQAVQYIRFRKDRKGDIGRIQRQQKFIKEIAKKLTSPKRILELPILVRTLRNLIRTDMSAREMVSLAVQFSEIFNSGNINRSTVPGAIVLERGMSFWKPDIIKLDHVVDTVLLGFSHQSNKTGVFTEDKVASKEDRDILSQMNVSRITDQIEGESQDDRHSLSGIKIEILNGFGVKGAANQAAQFFKTQGAHIARVENAVSFGYEETVIVDWNGGVRKAMNMAQFLKIDPSRIIVYDNRSKPMDLTIVLGEDWPLLYKGRFNGTIKTN